MENAIDPFVFGVERKFPILGESNSILFTYIEGGVILINGEEGRVAIKGPLKELHWHLRLAVEGRKMELDDLWATGGGGWECSMIVGDIAKRAALDPNALKVAIREISAVRKKHRVKKPGLAKRKADKGKSDADGGIACGDESEGDGEEAGRSPYVV